MSANRAQEVENNITNQKVAISYHFPSFGNVTATLHNESARLYRFLESADEIARLKGLDHLGIVRFVFEGAHHPRWEYVVLVLSLIEQCRNLPNVQLSRSLPIENDRMISSGYELLKCWAMLLNIGHLKWTFSSEKALLTEVVQDERAIRDILVLFDGDSQMQNWCKAILAECRVYQFFQILAFLRLSTLQTKVELPDDEFNYWRQLIRAYILNDANNEAFSRLRTIYRNIRTVAYLALDSHYTPSAIQLSLLHVFGSPKDLSELVMRGIEEATEISVLQQYLYRNIYVGRDVLESHARREYLLRMRIRESLMSDTLRGTVERLAGIDAQYDVKPESVKTVVRLPLWIDSGLQQLLLNSSNVCKEQIELEQDRRRRGTLTRPVVWGVPFSRERVLQIVAPESLTDQVVAFAQGFTWAAGRHREIERKWLELFSSGTSGQLGIARVFVQRITFEQIAVELVQAALRLVSSANLRWEWKHPTGGLRAVLLPKTGAHGVVTRLVERGDTGGASAPSSRVDELQFLADILAGDPDHYVAAAVTNLVAYERADSDPVLGKPKMLAELDGVVVEVSESWEEVTVTILEVKRQLQGGRSAVLGQLNGTIDKLNLRPDVEKDGPNWKETSTGADGAWVRLCIRLRDEEPGRQVKDAENAD